MLTPTSVRRDAVRQPSEKASLRLRNDRTGPTATAQLDFIGTVMRYPPNVEVYGEGEPTDYFYKVLSGAVRTSKFLHDGRRQIGGFYLRDELFGLDFGDQHPFSAETITETKVLVIKRSSAISLSARNPEVAHQLFAMTARELQRMQDHVVLLIKSAQERVATFLLEMADRNPTQEEVIELPMLRQDIADYLGLTVETISRTLSMLEASGAIKLATSRRIVLRDRSALVQLNGSEDHESRH